MTFKSFEEVGRAVESVALTICTTQKYHLTFRKSFTKFSSVPTRCYQEAIRDSNYGLVYDQMDSIEAQTFRQAIRQEARRQMDDCGLESTEKTRERLESLVEVPSKVEDAITGEVNLEELEVMVRSTALHITNDKRLNGVFRRSFDMYRLIHISDYKDAIQASSYEHWYASLDQTKRGLFRRAIHQETRRQMGGTDLESPSVTRDRLSLLLKVHKVAKIQPTVKISTQESYLAPIEVTSNLSKFKPQPKEEEKSMKITRPVLVGNTNILKATDEQLTQIIRDCKDLIKDDADMTKISTKFQQKTAELEEVIKLCLVQLDGDKS